MSTLRPVSGPAAEVTTLLDHWLAEADPAPLEIETSGSTGEPKRALLSRAAVLASARATHERLGGPGQWLLALPSAYVAGVQVLVRSLDAGHPPVMLEEHAGLAEAVAAMTAPRRYASLVPTQLVRALERPEDVAALADLDAVLLGGAAADEGLRARAEEAGVTVVTTYGMSETSGGCVYDGVPLPGVEVRTADDGRLEVRGPVLFDGYRDDPVRTAAARTDDGWFRTDDLGTVVDGRVTVLGRADDVVVSGGVKVPAAAVAARLRTHPGVEAAEVLGVPDPEWGQRVVAFVVGDLGLDAARDWVAALHPRPWAPRTVHLLDALPLLPNGKVDRVRLRARQEDS
ncbi:MAG: o-succinylbenzoate--CoA ligase [Nocardioides sp.]|nr:o-succinylbenzoate--CoA ligase [Nocardioides sp.]